MGINSPAPAELGPWLSKYPLPAEPGPLFVTRDMASDWSDYRTRPGTDHQRKLSRVKVGSYIEEMVAGRWWLNPQGLIFDTDGWLFNGQHRMAALRNVPAGVLNNDGLDFWVFPCESRGLFDKVDTGYARQARQLYAGNHSDTVTAAVRYLVPGRVGLYARTMSPAAVLAEVAKWPELDTHARAAVTARNRARIPKAAHLAVLAQAERSSFRLMIGEWLEGLITGSNLVSGDPRLHLRNHFLGHPGRANMDTAYPLVAKAWSMYVAGDRRQVFRWGVNEPIPTVPGLTLNN